MPKIGERMAAGQGREAPTEEGSLDARHALPNNRRSERRIAVSRGVRGLELAELEYAGTNCIVRAGFMPDANRAGAVHLPVRAHGCGWWPVHRAPRTHAHSHRAAPPGTARLPHDVVVPRSRRLRPVTPNAYIAQFVRAADASSTIPISGK
jgi:hypothetical protein